MLMCSCIHILSFRAQKTIAKKSSRWRNNHANVRRDSFIIYIFMSMETDQNMYGLEQLHESLFFFLFLIKPVFSDLWLMIIAAQQPPPSTLQLTATFQAWFSECVWERTRERETSVTPSQLYRKRCFLRRDTSFLVFLLVMQFAAVVKIAEQGIRKIEKGVILRFIFIQMLGIVGFGSSLCWFWF